MAIGEFPDANYTPTMAGYSGQSSFRFWCQTVLPLVYDDSLSYYELLNKVVNYLNNVISDVSNVETNVESLLNAYNSLQEYVNTYFDSLDVQEEINNKLDEMASDGSLSTIISPFIPNLVTDWLDENVTPTTPIVDASLSISGAAADAKVVGDKFTEDEYTIGGLVSSGKNLLNPKQVKTVSQTNVTITPNYNGFKISATSGTYRRCVVDITLEPNTTYTISCDIVKISGAASVRWCESEDGVTYPSQVSGIITGVTEDGHYSGSFTTGEFGYARIGFYCTYGTSMAGEVEYNNVMLEKDSSETSFEPYFFAYDAEARNTANANTDAISNLGNTYSTLAQTIKQNNINVTTSGTYSSFNDIPVGVIAFINNNDGYAGMSDSPWSGFVGDVMTFSRNGNAIAGAVQIAIGTSASNYGRIKIRTRTASVWQDWLELNEWRESNYYAETYSTKTETVKQNNINVTSSGTYTSFDDIPVGVIGFINNTNAGITDEPWWHFIGDVMTFSRNGSNVAGAVQIAVGTYGTNSGRIALRTRTASTWSSWYDTFKYEPVVYIGEGETYTDPISAFIFYKDTKNITFIIKPGTYDLYQSYIDNNVPFPPANVEYSDYFDYNVFVPSKAKVIGLGRVVLNFNIPSTIPDVSSDVYTAITKTWSPINVKDEVYIENLEIYGSNCRYIIHDDGHAINFNTNHIYKNIRAYYGTTGDSYGFNEVFGFGVYPGCYYEFDNCMIVNNNVTTNRGTRCFGSHGSGPYSTYGQSEYKCARVVFNNCVLTAPASNSNKYSFRFYAQNATQEHINVDINNCYLSAGILLYASSNTYTQNFDIKLLNSGNPAITESFENWNTFTPQIYNS